MNVIRNPENSGFAKGNNIAIQEAKGEFIVLINTDVVIIPGCMKILHSYIISDPSTGMVVPQVLNRDRSIQTSLRREVSFLRLIFRILWIDTIFPSLVEYSHKKLESVDSASGCFFMLRRDALEQTGLLDTYFYL